MMKRFSLAVAGLWVFLFLAVSGLWVFLSLIWTTEHFH